MRPHYSLAALVLSVLALCPHAAVAGSDAGASVFPTQAQAMEFERLSARIDARLKSGLAGREKQADLMRRELGQIAALKDPTAVAKAVSAYQSRHALFHADLMARSGISLAAIAGEMQRIAPGMRFDVKPNGTIIGHSAQPLVAPPPKAPPTAAAKTIPLSNLVSEGNSDCGAISGGSNAFTPTSAESRASATVAGRCTSSGDLKHALPTGGARRATLAVGYGTSVDLSTVSVIGSSIASAHLSVSMDRAPLFSSSHTAFAPFLWAASEQATGSGLSQRTDVPVTGDHFLHLSTQASASAAVGADTRAKAALRDIRASLELDF
jgi:hypothetical protein